MPRSGDTIPQPAFPDDDGRAPADLIAAMSSAHVDVASRVQALRLLASSRLLVPVVAILDEAEGDATGSGEPVREKASHMATLLLTGRDGRRGLLAFTSLATLRAYRDDARPVAVSAATAAAGALAEEAALLVDLGAPWALPVQGEDLHGLAGGLTPALAPGTGYVWLRLAQG